MSQATVTAYIGPGHSVTAAVTPNVTNIEFDLVGEVLRLKHASGKYTDYALTGANTITLTVSGGNYTLTVA